MYSIGDSVVYPLHGAGVIEAIEEREVSGLMYRYYAMRIPLGDMKVLIPIDGAEKIGALHGIGSVPIQRLAAVFRAADGNIGMGLVELIKPGAVHGGLAAVPTEIVVIGHHIRDLQIGVIHLAHGHSRNGSQAGLVHLVAEVIQDTVILQKIVIRAADADLIGKSPNHNGRVGSHAAPAASPEAAA